jgi:hypothetical protein
MDRYIDDYGHYEPYDGEKHTLSFVKNGEEYTHYKCHHRRHKGRPLDSTHNILYQPVFVIH